MLANKLEQALGERARVQRSGTGLLGRGEKHVRAIRVELGPNRYELTFDRKSLAGYRERQSGGIAIKRESLPPHEWIAALTDDLRAEAERSASSRAALESLLG